jgi:hypothetical protein
VTIAATMAAGLFGTSSSHGDSRERPAPAWRLISHVTDDALRPFFAASRLIPMELQFNVVFSADITTDSSFFPRWTAKEHDGPCCLAVGGASAYSAPRHFLLSSGLGFPQTLTSLSVSFAESSSLAPG